MSAKARLCRPMPRLKCLALAPCGCEYTRLDSFISYLPAGSPTFTFQGLALNGSSFLLDYYYPFTAALSVFYGSPGPRYKPTNREVSIAPTSFPVLPPQVLAGNPERTLEKIEDLKLCSSYVDLRTVKYHVEAVHEGMRNAIVQRHYDALLTLVSLASKLADVRNTVSDDENPFEPPVELFRLVARQGLHDFTATSEMRSWCEKAEAEISIGLFTLLIRTHAESMPQKDPNIEAWANCLRTSHDSDGTDVAFAQWVSDWSRNQRPSELMNFPGRPEERGWKNDRKGGRPLFSRGGVSRSRRCEEMVRRFVEILEAGEFLGARKIFGRMAMQFGEEETRVKELKEDLELEEELSLASLFLDSYLGI